MNKRGQGQINQIEQVGSSVWEKLFFGLIILLVIAGIVFAVWKFNNPTLVNCGAGEYDSKQNACIFNLTSGQKISVIKCPVSFEFNEKQETCEKLVESVYICNDANGTYNSSIGKCIVLVQNTQYACQAGTYNSSTGQCTVFIENITYSCDDGRIQEINGTNFCVVSLDVFREEIKYSCGNGICDEKKLSQGICPEDCGGSKLNPNNQTNMNLSEYEDSPFGLWEAFSLQSDDCFPVSVKNTLACGLDSESFIDLNVHWWTGVMTVNFVDEPLTWGFWYNQLKNVNVIPVSSFPRRNIDAPLADYYNELKSYVLQYHDIDYWLLDVEPDLMADVDSPSAKNLAISTRLAYKALKDVDSSKKLLQGGTFGSTGSYTSPNSYFTVVFDTLEDLEEIEKNPSLYNWNQNKYSLSQSDFNILFSEDDYDKYMDGQHFSNFDSCLSQTKNNTQLLAISIREFFNQYGYVNPIIWDTQTGAPSASFLGKPASFGICTRNITNEKEQAQYVLIKYVSSIISGVDKIFWTTTYEFNWLNNPDEYFSKVGLIYNGEKSGNVDSDDLGLGVKKLSYYSYKFMTSKLEGSNWDNVQEVYNSGNVYAYKFINKQTQKLTYVVWWDYWNEPTLTTKQISIPVLISGNVKVTEAVPKYETGQQVTNYATAFNIGGASVSNGQITINLGQSPVYIEETTENLETYIPHAWQNPTTPTSSCGDGACNGEETVKTCAQDCGGSANSCSTGQTLCATDQTCTGTGTKTEVGWCCAGTCTDGRSGGSCGDGICDGAAGEKDSCPSDCVVVKT